MTHKFSTVIFTAAFAFTLLAFSCKGKIGEVIIIGTEDPNAIVTGGNYSVTGDTTRDKTSSLMKLDLSEINKAPESLTFDFFSARSPEISYDGKRMLFCARLKSGDPWQVYEMKINNAEWRRITGSDNNCSDPVYLPGDRIAYIMHHKNDSLRAEQSIHTCQADGTADQRITYDPASYRLLSILKDGRLVSARSQVFPEKGSEYLIVMRPDGTKSEMFYETPGGNVIKSRPREVNGEICFAEYDASLQKNCLISIRYSRPLHSRSLLTGASTSKINSVSSHNSGRWLIATENAGTSGSLLLLYNSESNEKSEILYSGNTIRIFEIAEAAAYDRPKKLPSEVDSGVSTGLLFCQNIGLTGNEAPSSKITPEGAYRIEILGINGSYGIVDAENDGSFYLKLSADIPFRLRTLDASGNTIHGPGSWLYVRPNERRGCVGCHEDRETVPANRMARAITKNPVELHFAKRVTKDKEIELE